jgi:hypothetical protein
MSLMSKQRKQPTPAEPEPEPIILYVRLDKPTSAAFREFVDSQPVPPSNPAVTVKALHEFLAKHGHWPRKE